MHLGTRDSMVRLENTLFDLMRRIDVLRAAGVKIPQAERDAVSKVYRALMQQINEYAERDRSWTPKRSQKGPRG